MDQKRINMHFNLDNIEDREIYEFLSSRTKKGTYAKELLHTFITKSNLYLADFPTIKPTNNGITLEQLQATIRDMQKEEPQVEIVEEFKVQDKSEFSLAELENLNL